MTTILLLLLSVLSVAHTVPIQSDLESDQCATQCRQPNNFRYSTGTTYQYDYRVLTTTDIAGASQDSAKIQIEARAEIEVLSACDFGLRLTDVRLKDTDGSQEMDTADRQSEFSRSLEQFNLRFSFDDGVIDHICPAPNDPAWVVNIKRGILSAYQNGMEDWNENQNKTETDVTGVCPTAYQVYSAGYYTSILKKSKDILACNHRNVYQGFQRVVPYTIESSVQDLPIMKTTQDCLLTVATKGLLKKSECEETHVYRPFSNGQSGGSTKVIQTLTFTGERRGIRIPQDQVTKRSTLLFDHQETQMTNQENVIVEVMATLNSLCFSTAKDVRPETPRTFSKLVSQMEKLDSGSMTSLYQRLQSSSINCQDNKRVRKILLDTLPFVQTAASIEFMSTLLTRGNVGKVETQMWIASLAFIKAPTPEMLKSVKVLVDNQKTRHMAMLPVSSMINNYCSRMTNDQSCDDLVDVTNIISSMETAINRYCDTRGARLEPTIHTLRALGNAGHLTRSLGVITRCMRSRYSTMEVKVTAAQAFRRMPCDADDQDLWTTLRDTKMDPEYRIAAYTSLMRCPDDALVDNMADIFAKEVNEQVGSFMYSHMTNLGQTSDPHKQGIARAINRLSLEKRFSLDPLDNSRNYEISTLLNKINMGFTSDTNVILANRSALLRSINSNMTVHLFGNSINVIDFGARIDGLQKLTQYIFGVIRTEQDLTMSLYGRMFGNEIFFSRVQSKPSLLLPKAPSSWMDALIKMSKDHKYQMTHSSLLMDTSMTIPSLAGLPVHFHVNTTATVDVQMSGKVDLRKVAAKPRSLDVQGEIRPSAAIEITGTMMVDAMMTKTGVRMRNVMHTSTATKGRILLERGQQFHFEIDTPQDTMEILEASSKFFLVHNTVEKEQSLITENRKSFDGCIGHQVTKVVGMELCGHLSFPNASMKMDSPYFPLTGPSSVKVTMKKKDTHSSYKLFVKRVENKQSSMAQISFNTPGSKVSRYILLDLALNYPSKELEVTLATPWKKAAMKGSMINAKDIKSLAANLVLDEKTKYSLTSEFKVSDSRTNAILTPMIVFRRPKQKDIQMTGTMTLAKPWRILSADLSVTGLQKMPYLFKGDIFNTKAKKGLSLSLSTDSKRFYNLEATNHLVSSTKRGMTLNSILEASTPERQLVSLKGNVNYRVDKMLKMDATAMIHRIMKRSTFGAAITKTAKNNAVRYNSNIRLKSSRLSGRIVGMTNIKGTKLLASKMTVDFVIPRVTRKKIILNTKINDRSTKAFSKYSIKSNLDIKQNPEYNCVLNIGLDYKKRLAAADLEFKYGANPKDKTKRVHLNCLVKKKVKNVKNAQLTYKMLAEAPQQDVNWVVTGKHQHSPRMVDSVVKMNYGKGKQINMDVDWRDQSTKLKKMSGKVSLGWPGREYQLVSSVSQKNAKQYQHKLSMKNNQGMKHDVATTLTLAKAKTHSVASTINLSGMRPITLEASSTLDPKNFIISGQARKGKDVYRMRANGKYVPRAPRGKIDVEVQFPSRKMGVLAEAGAENGKYQGILETTWSAGKTKNQKVSLEGHYLHKTRSDSMSFASMVKFVSPFENLKDVSTMVKMGSDVSKYDLSTHLSWGGKARSVSTLITVKKPLSPYNVQASMMTKTPLNGYRVVQLDVMHKINPSLGTVLKGVLEDNKAEIALTGENKGDRYRRDLKGQVLIKSTIEGAKSIMLTMSHSDDSRKFTTSTVLQHDGDEYSYDMNMNHNKAGWRIENDGKIDIAMPQRTFSSSWIHKSSDRDISSSLFSKWNKERLSISLNSNHRSGSVSALDSTLTVQTPWRGFQDVKLTSNHKYGDGLVNSKTIWMDGRRQKGMAVMSLKRMRSSTQFDMSLSSPYNEDISSEINANYQRYPMTTTATVQWSPTGKASMTGSAVTKAWNDVDVNVKFTSPWENFENVLLKASSKEKRRENVVQLNLDTGLRQAIDVEGRLQNDRTKILRLKATTPYRQFSILDTGIVFDGEISDFVSSVDFKLMPHVDKMSGNVMLKYNGELKGNIRVDTPFDGMHSMDVAVSSKSDAALRTVSMTMKYPPRQTHTLDTSFKFQMPITFETKLTSSKPDLDGLSISFQHDHSLSDIKTRAAVKYRPDKEIQADVLAQWRPEIEGRVLLKTPFTDLEDNRVTFQYRRKPKSLDARGEYTVAGHTAKIDANVKTGFLTTGSFNLKSSFPGAESVEATFRKRGKIENMKGNAVIKFNSQKINGNFVNKVTKDSVKSDLFFSSPFTETFNANLEMKGTMESFNIKTTSRYGRKSSVESIVTFDQSGNDITGNTMFKYRMGRKRETMRMIVTKSGSMKNVQVGVTASRNRATIVFNSSLKRDWRTDFLLELKTPWRGYTDLGLALNHAGDLNKFKTTSKVKFLDGKTLDGSVDFTFANGKNIELLTELNSDIEGMEATSFKLKHTFDYRTKDVQGSAELQTTVMRFGQGDITYSKRGSLHNFNLEGRVTRNGKDTAKVLATGLKQYSNVKGEFSLMNPLSESVDVTFESVGDSHNLVTATTLKYGRRGVVSVKVTAQQGRESTKATGEMAYVIEGLGSKDMSFDLSLDGHRNDASLIASAKVDKDAYVINGKFKNMEDLSGSVAVKIPIDGYSDLRMSFKHSGGLDRFNSEAKLKISDADEYFMKLEFYRYLLRRIETTLEMKTPMKGFEFTKFEYRHESESDSFMCLSTVEYGQSKKIVYEMSAKDNPKPEYKVSLETPFDDYENLMALLSYGENDAIYDATSSLNMGRGMMFSFRGSLENSDQPTGYIVLTTPFKGFSDLSANFQHKGSNRKFATNAKVVYMDGKSLEAKVDVSQYWPYRLEATADISTPFRGWEKSNINIKHNDNRRKMTSSIKADYGRRQTIEGTAILIYRPTYDLTFDIRTPFNDVRKLQGKGSLKTSRSSYEGDYAVTVNDYKSYSASGKWNSNSWKAVSGMLRMDDPYTGFNEGTYSHTISDRAIQGNAMLRYNADQVISVDMNSVTSPLIEGTLTVKTPFYGYEDMQSSLMYKSDRKAYDATTKLNFGRGRVYEMEAGVDYSLEPFTIYSKVSTPHRQLPKAEFKVTVEGEVENFKSTLYVFSPVTRAVDATANLRYNTIFDMVAMATLKSALDQMDDIEVKIRNVNTPSEKKATGVVQWTNGKVMTYDILFRSQESRYEDKYHTDISVTTPFDRVSSWSMQLDQTITQKAYDEKFLVELNGEQVIDMDTLVDYEKLEVIVRQPWPMQMVGRVTNTPEDKRGHLYVNWDRDDPVSNVNVQVALESKQETQGFSLDIVHPTRSVGVTHKTTDSAQLKRYEGKISWDSGDDSQVSYDLEMKDNSQRRRQIYEGNLNVGLPGRGLGLTGSYSGYGQSQALDSSFSWDTQKDTSKKIGVKATLTGQVPRNGELVISMPSFNKEIKIDGQVMMDNGRVILDAKTDISYSQDTRKTLTLLSKLEDIRDYQGIYNYSLALGVTHPYTKTDIMVTSHLGRSAQKMTIGMDTRYLTARRQNKNMALFAEINQLKNQLHLMMSDPSHSMELHGHVVSETPYKLQVTGKMDNTDLLKTDLTVDFDKKALLLKALNGENKGISISAMYPNTTAINIEAVSSSAAFNEREFLIGLRLNTSRLLHTSLTWRPGAFQDLRQFLLTTAEIRGEKSIENIRALGDSVVEEMASKYSVMINALSEEALPMLTDVQSEFNEVYSQLQGLVKNMDDFRYENYQAWDSLGQHGQNVYMAVRNGLSGMSDRWHAVYTDGFSVAQENIEQWRRYPFRSVYTRWLDDVEQTTRDQMRGMMDGVRRIDLNLDEMFRNMRDRKDNMIEDFYDNDYIQRINNQISQIPRMDTSYLTSYMSDFRFPPTYRLRLSDARQMVMAPLAPLMAMPQMRYVQNGLNELYQQGRWSYEYWQFEKNVPLHLMKAAGQVSDVVSEELKEWISPMQSMAQNPVTVWLPDSGVVQLCIPLPLPVHRLDQWPDWGPYADQAQTMWGKVAPDGTFIMWVYESSKGYLETPTMSQGAAGKALTFQKPKMATRRRVYKPRPRVNSQQERRRRWRRRQSGL